jgi:NADH-quinone oxidoreductase subunit F
MTFNRATLLEVNLMQAENLALLHSTLVKLAPQGRTALLPALHAAQAMVGYLPESVAHLVAQALGVPLADVHGVIEFYTMFYNQPVGRSILRICTDPACQLRGAEQALEEACQNYGVHEGQVSADGEWTVERAPCLGMCNRAPAVNLGLPAQSKPEDEHHVLAPRSYAYGLRDPEGGIAADHIAGSPRLITALCSGMKAASLEEYSSSGGMRAAHRWIGERRSAAELISEIKASGLVGMGGAAFPTGIKWEGAANAAGDSKYLVINADESEPGTFKDRILLEGDPCRVLEGAMLGAYAIGAQKIYCYIRGEYPLAIERVHTAVEQLHEAGYLGENIFGSEFSLEVEIRAGAGAYICGEETALFESIEGKRGFPRIKPPFPTTQGLFGKPTVINNVETLAKIPLILADGVAAFRSLGTEKSPGTKLFCLSGDVSRPGLYEVPFGTSLRHLLFDLAGGVEGNELQAVLLGGAAGAFATPQHLDVRLSFEDLRAAGLPLGSGVVMVFNQQRSMARILASLARFFAHESCGKCYPCQMGTQRQYEILQRVAAGQSQPGDTARLQDVGWTMTDSSLCGLGQTAASAVLSALRLWPDLAVQ